MTWDEHEGIQFVFLVSPSFIENEGITVVTKAIVRFIDRTDLQHHILETPTFHNFNDQFSQNGRVRGEKMSETISSEELQVTAFDIILHSGNARTLIHEGFKDMRQGKFEEADEQLTKANEEILQAHKAQTNLLKEYASGQKSKWRSSWFMHKTI